MSSAKMAFLAGLVTVAVMLGQSGDAYACSLALRPAAVLAVPQTTVVPMAQSCPGPNASAGPTPVPTSSVVPRLGRTMVPNVAFGQFGPNDPRSGGTGMLYSMDWLGWVRNTIQAAVNWLRGLYGSAAQLAARICQWIAQNLGGRGYYYSNSRGYCVENRGILGLPLGSTCQVYYDKHVDIRVWWGQ